MLYLKDPKDDKPSVSLTMSMATWIVALGFAIKLALGGNIDPLENLFMVTTALYFGRRITGRNISTDKEKESE